MDTLPGNLLSPIDLEGNSGTAVISSNPPSENVLSGVSFNHSTVLTLSHRNTLHRGERVNYANSFQISSMSALMRWHHYSPKHTEQFQLMKEHAGLLSCSWQEVSFVMKLSSNH